MNHEYPDAEVVGKMMDVMRDGWDNAESMVRNAVAATKNILHEKGYPCHILLGAYVYLPDGGDPALVMVSTLTSTTDMVNALQGMIGQSMDMHPVLPQEMLS